MTEAQAWREIAQWFAGRTTVRARSGLCISIAYVGVDNDTRSAMCDRVNRYIPSGWAYFKTGYWGEYLGNDNSREARDARVLAALWLALDAEAEA